MMTASKTPPTLSGCDVLPPMEPAATPVKATAPTRAKGKPGRRKTADRFAVLNTFADFTLRDLSRAEIAVWLLLWRDTRDGTARTSQADIAKRAGVNASTVKRAVARLEARGLLTVVFRGDLWRGPSRYAVHSMTKATNGKLGKPTHPSGKGHRCDQQPGGTRAHFATNTGGTGAPLPIKGP